MRRKARIGCFCLTALVGAVAAAGAPAQEIDPSKLFEQAKPHLEAVLGQRLDGPLKWRPAQPSEFRQVPDPELAWQVRFTTESNQAAGAAYAIAKEKNWAVNPAVVDPRNAEIIWQPALAKNIASWNPTVARADSSEFLQLTFVQAVACRYLEQKYTLTRRWQECRSAEELAVLQAMYAGRALWITRQVAERLGTGSYVPLLWQRFRYVPDDQRDGAWRAFCQDLLQRKFEAATNGLAFCDYLEEQRWPDAEKRMFAQPPRQLSWINHPERYLRAQQSARPSLGVCLQRLEAALPAAEWTASQQPCTPEMVLQAATLLGMKPQAEKALLGWDEARLLLWTEKGKASGRMVVVSVSRFDDEGGARLYFAFANDVERQRDAMKNAPDAGMLRVLDSHIVPCSLRETAESVRFDKLLQASEKSAPVSEKRLLTRNGDTVVEIVWYGLPEDLVWAERALAVVLGK